MPGAEGKTLTLEKELPRRLCCCKVCPATNQQLSLTHWCQKFFLYGFTMGVPKGEGGSCKGCGNKHVRPWGQYCLDVIKAKAVATFQGVSEDTYRQFLFAPVPTGCTFEPCDPEVVDDRDGIDESFEEDKDDLKSVAIGGTVSGQTRREKDQACTIAKLEAELDRLRVTQMVSIAPTTNASPAAYMAVASLQSQLGVMQPVMSGAWGQPQVQVQAQEPARRKLAFFELDTFISQVPGPNHVYSMEEIVAGSLALIEYRLAHNLSIGGYHAHLRFLLGRAAYWVHKDHSLIDYDRFV